MQNQNKLDPILGGTLGDVIARCDSSWCHQCGW